MKSNKAKDKAPGISRRGLIGPLKQVRTNIIAGVLVVIPIITTLFVFMYLFQLFDSVLPKVLGALLPRIPDVWAPGVGLVILVTLFYVVGIVAKNYFGSKLIQIGDALIGKIPFINKIYQLVQQILETVIKNKKGLFEKAVLVEFPKEGSYSIGFLTAKAPLEVSDHLHDELVTLFVPTTPNPTSGFLIFVPESKVQYLDMSVETAIKTVVSAGVVSSEQLNSANEKGAIPNSIRNWNFFTRKKSPDPRD